ncbi:MAG: helix-turn-helix domain-containing protein [Acidimicrobiia bacterium]|nr:helix-turn-helix domain-containing protein [Acidimicrobiia bacterium]
MTTSHPTAAEHKAHGTSSRLLTTPQVAEFLGVDRSTIYRMAADGRLPAIKVGRQWRFPTDQITQRFPSLPAVPPPPPSDDQPPQRLHTNTVIDTNAATGIIQLAAEALDAMIVITDPDGLPLTDVANPHPAALDPTNHDTILATWQQMAHQPQMAAHFEQGPLGLLCAKSPIRHDTQTLGFVFAAEHPPDTRHGIDLNRQQSIAKLLPKIAQLIAAIATTPDTP